MNISTKELKAMQVEDTILTGIVAGLVKLGMEELRRFYRKRIILENRKNENPIRRIVDLNDTNY